MTLYGKTLDALRGIGTAITEPEAYRSLATTQQRAAFTASMGAHPWTFRLLAGGRTLAVVRYDHERDAPLRLDLYCATASPLPDRTHYFSTARELAEHLRAIHEET